MKLADVLLTDKRPAVIKDCVRLLDAEVASKKGVRGLAIKGGYKVIKAIKPGIISEAFDDLLEPFTERLEPFFEAFLQNGATRFEQYISARSDEVAEALLGITDDRAARADNRTIKKTYQKMRPFGKKNVEQAVPGIGRLIDQHRS